MQNETTWNNESRIELKKTLSAVVMGEVRLFKNDHSDIREMCREVYIEDECPAAERETYYQHVENELVRATTQLESDQAAWADETDCDRLDQVESDLRDQGILLWQVSPCCDTCSGAELPDRISEIDGRYPGFRDRVRGYAFFIEQNMPEMLAESTQISVYLAYGWFPQDGTDVAPAEYEKNALGIAREICDSLRKHGFEVDWNGDFSRKIGVFLDWQRRTKLD